MELTEGAAFTYERTFTEDAVRAFAAVSRDRGVHHVEPDEEGRLLVHGLLTATLPTKIGGDQDVLAREMEFAFRRPVYTGDTVRCTVTFTTVERRERGVEVAADVVCRRIEGDGAEGGAARGGGTPDGGDSDGDGEVVLTGGFEGVIREE